MLELATLRYIKSFSAHSHYYNTLLKHFIQQIIEQKSKRVQLIFCELATQIVKKPDYCITAGSKRRLENASVKDKNKYLLK